MPEFQPAPRALQILSNGERSKQLSGDLQLVLSGGTNASGAENSPRYFNLELVGHAALSGERGAERSAEPAGRMSQRRRCPHRCGGRGAVRIVVAPPACGREHHPSLQHRRAVASPGHSPGVREQLIVKHRPAVVSIPDRRLHRLRPITFHFSPDPV